jgi:hypothetical protein
MDIKQYMKNRFGKTYFGTTTYSNPKYSTSSYSDSRSFQGPHYGYAGMGYHEDYEWDGDEVVYSPPKKTFFKNVYDVNYDTIYVDGAGNKYEMIDYKDTICHSVKHDMVNVIINGENRKKHKKKGIWMQFDSFNKIIVREEK